MSQIPNEEGFHIRPRFEVDSSLSLEELYTMFRNALNQENAPCAGNVRMGYISLFPKEKDHHYWSPHLNISIEEMEEEDVRHMRGLYGPSASVWTMFIFFYTVLGLATIICSVIGFANISIGDSGAILWVVPFLIILFCSLYLVSYYGQKKGHDQIVLLHDFVETCLDEKIK